MPYEPKRIPLYTPAGNRELNTLKDARLVNCWVEKDSAGRVWVQKRPALVTAYSISPPAIGLGMFWWDDGIFSIFGTTLYVTTAGFSNALATVDGGSLYSFSTTLGAAHKLFFHNKFKYYTGTGVTSIDGNPIPIATVVAEIGASAGSHAAFGSAYLDGTSYIANDNNAIIYGSAFNDPATIPGDNFILAQIEADDIRFIAKHLVYVIVGKQWTTEVFHDAGNPAGSPLAPDQGLKMNFGCLAPYSLQDVGGDLLWISSTREGSASVVHLTNLRAEIISTPAIERLLTSLVTKNATSWSGKVGGHKLYAINTTERTLVYDISMGLWYEWTGANGSPFPIIASTFDGFAGSPTFGKALFQNAADGDVYTLELGIYHDDNGVFSADIYTPNWDDGVKVRKQVSYTELLGDQEPGSFCTVAVSDDDYKTWSEPRVVDRGMERQILNNGGTFRRRAFWLHHHEDKAFRVQALELMVAHGAI